MGTSSSRHAIEAGERSAGPGWRCASRSAPMVEEGMSGLPPQSSLREVVGFHRLWGASTISSFGDYVTALAIQVLIVVRLHGGSTDVGIVSAARWLPYMLLGLVAGVLVDRSRHRPLLIGTDLGRGALLTAIPLLALADRLPLPVLA